MSLGLPGHLAPRAVSAGLSRAAHVIAAICLIAAAGATLTQQMVAPTRLIWPALAAVVVVGVLLVAVDRKRTPVRVASYVLIGAALSSLYAVVVLVQVPVVTTSGNWVFTMLKISLVMVGAVGASTAGAVVPALAGYLLGELAIGAATVAAGRGLEFDVAPALALLLIVVVAVGMALRRPAARGLQPALHRAARDERLAEVRKSVETRAAALLHDTILNDLAAIAAAPEGPVPDALRERLSRDLEAIVGQDWSEAAAAVGPSFPIADWAASGLAQAVEQGRAAGLAITVSGDPGAVSALPGPVDEALGLAVRQLLVNVQKHSGVNEAEVVVYAGGGTVSAMVIDAGVGFEESETARDRLGLRHSVRSRIAAVGGRVEVWSAKGHGTSVLLQVPTGVGVREAAPAGEPR